MTTQEEIRRSLVVDGYDTKTNEYISDRQRDRLRR